MDSPLEYSEAKAHKASSNTSALADSHVTPGGDTGFSPEDFEDTPGGPDASTVTPGEIGTGGFEPEDFEATPGSLLVSGGPDGSAAFQETPGGFFDEGMTP